MSKKLYVGNLPFTTTDQELNEIFTQSGKVISAKVIIDRDTGRSKGFGFVEMATDDQALNAVSQFNGAQLNGRPLTVNEARPMASRAGGAESGRSEERRGRW